MTSFKFFCALCSPLLSRLWLKVRKPRNVSKGDAGVTWWYLNGRGSWFKKKHCRKRRGTRLWTCDILTACCWLFKDSKMLPHIDWKIKYLPPFRICSVHQSRFVEFWVFTHFVSWAGSAVDIATELRAGRSGIEFWCGRNFPPVQTGPRAYPASCKMGIGPLPAVNYGRGVLLTTPHLLVPRSWKSRAIPLPNLWVTPDL